MFSLFFKFAEKFAEFKEAARLAKEKSQEKTELTGTPSQVTEHVHGSVWWDVDTCCLSGSRMLTVGGCRLTS